MTATYTFDVFTSLDGFGSHHGDWGGYWGKQGPELLDHRLSLYDRSNGWCSAPPPLREFVACLGRSAAAADDVGRLGHPDEEHAGDRGVVDAAGAPRLARTRPSRAVTPSTSSPGSRRSPTCRCAHTAACR